MEKLSNNKTLKIIGNVLYFLLVLLILAVLVIVVLQKVSKNTITIGGIRMFNIETGSMVPKYVVGDVLISKEVDPTTLVPNQDDITYLGKVGTFNGKVVTHQLIDKKEENGKLIFTTKGIANDEADPEIEASQVYGKVIYKVKSLSFLSKIMRNIYGFYFFVFFPLTILIVIKIQEIIRVLRNKEEDNDNQE